MTKFYTGIGSRETPHHVLARMTEMAQLFERLGYVLRSGGAPGADQAFEKGVTSSQKKIYLPWKGFNNCAGLGTTVAPTTLQWGEALKIAQQFHPAWQHVKTPAMQALMGRNVFQVLGENLNTPSELVVCWANKPKWDDAGLLKDVAGGTGLAVRLAYAWGIPVYLVGEPKHDMALEDILKKEPDISAQKTQPPPKGRWKRAPI